jgi:hypothetical protein
MRSGAVSERPTLARHIAEIGGGASPGTASKWPTPNVPCGGQTFTEGSMTETGQTPNGKKRSVHLSERVGMWPTPDAGAFGNQPNANTTQWDGRNTLISYAPYWSEKQWPSPRATDGEKGGPNQAGSKGDLMLPSAAHLWATPNASVANDGEGPETWRARQAVLKEKHMNGNGAGVPFANQAQESAAAWATPSARDWRSGDASDATMERNARPLNEQASHWATPRARDWHPSHKDDYEGDYRTDLGSEARRWDGPASRPDPTTATAGEPSSPSTPTSLQLNPRFVSVLMGLPPRWTCVCAPESIGSGRSAMPSCPSRPKPPSESYGTEPSGR